MPKKLAPEVEGAILTLSKLKYSRSMIRKKLRKQNYIVSEGTISNVINCVGERRQAKSTGQRSPVKRQPLKPSNQSALKKIDLMTQKENPPSQKQIAVKAGVPFGSVSRLIKKLGKRTAHKTTVHTLNARQMANRKTNSRKIYEKYLAGPKSEFVVTIDEAMFYVQNCNGTRKVCYVKRGETIPETWVQQKENFLTKHMVVGAMSGRGVVPLFEVPKKVKVNAEWYITKVLRPLVDKHLPRLYGSDLHKVVIHHDKASSHTSHKTAIFAAEVKRSKGITIIPNAEIPAKSPDISPMDFFAFGYLKQRLKRRKAKTWKGVWKVLKEEWCKVTLEMTSKVYRAWKRRLRIVSLSDGQHIESNRDIYSRRH